MANKGTEIQIGDGSLHIGDRVVYPNQGVPPGYATYTRVD